MSRMMNSWIGKDFPESQAVGTEDHAAPGAVAKEPALPPSSSHRRKH